MTATLRVVTLVGEALVAAEIPVEGADRAMDAFERSSGLGPDARTDRLIQASVRSGIARRLLDGPATDLYHQRLAAGCLWLAMRHWSRGAVIADAVADLAIDGGTVVLTAAIADDRSDAAPGTAWAFMVGRRVHDGRRQLRDTPPETVRLVGGGAGRDAGDD